MTAAGGAGVHLPPLRRGQVELAEDVAARLGSHLKAAEHAVVQAKTEALRPFGLTVAQFAALTSLYYVPEQSAAQLARGAAVTAQTMGQTIDKLAAKGLVSRTPSRDHRKVLVISLTAAGESLVESADEAARAVETRLGEAFTDEERFQLVALLQRAVLSVRGEPAAAQGEAAALQ